MSYATYFDDHASIVKGKCTYSVWFDDGGKVVDIVNADTMTQIPLHCPLARTLAKQAREELDNKEPDLEHPDKWTDEQWAAADKARERFELEMKRNQKEDIRMNKELAVLMQ